MNTASVTAITGLIVKSLELVHKRREGKLSSKDAQELYCRIFSSLLWEVHQNLEHCRIIKRKSESAAISVGILSFFVRDALFSDFCIMCPEPRVISDLNQIYSAFERLLHWQRVTTDLQSPGAGYIVSSAKNLFNNEKLDVKYNDLLDSLKSLDSDVEVPPKFKV